MCNFVFIFSGYKISMPLTATEKKLKNIISVVKAKLRKAYNTNKKLRMQMLMVEKISKLKKAICKETCREMFYPSNTVGLTMGYIAGLFFH